MAIKWTTESKRGAVEHKLVVESRNVGGKRIRRREATIPDLHRGCEEKGLVVYDAFEVVVAVHALQETFGFPETTKLTHLASFCANKEHTREVNQDRLEAEHASLTKAVYETEARYQALVKASKAAPGPDVISRFIEERDQALAERDESAARVKELEKLLAEIRFAVETSSLYTSDRMGAIRSAINEVRVKRPEGEERVALALQRAYKAEQEVRDERDLREALVHRLRDYDAMVETLGRAQDQATKFHDELDKLTVGLLAALHWEGGTVEQALEEVGKLRDRDARSKNEIFEATKEAHKAKEGAHKEGPLWMVKCFRPLPGDALCMRDRHHTGPCGSGGAS